ncbi:NADPH-dependent FMN reductase [Vibrio lentus]|uniref:NADPH-dependent FMN reductase n=1 Tax=Vibrio TaxID=662 RepID=UPI0002EEB9CF|nr:MULTISPECIES: NAD(P)H-dependent oxidoreductase [Vibrio]OCH48773.1 NADPH-dependent FMN reductase [Vibrio lentus]PMI55129.1 NADPH-dependent FMN reductase [Vibrio lentus]
MKVLAIGATNSKKSINQQLAAYTASLANNAQVEVLDLNDFEMPIYSEDREKASGIHQHAQRFFRKIGEADAVVISFAEYNGSYTAAFKNVFDWASRIDMKVYQGKPVVMLAASPGPGGATSVLSSAVNSAPYFAADIKGTLSVPSFYDNFDVETGEVTNAEMLENLKSIMSKL